MYTNLEQLIHIKIMKKFITFLTLIISNVLIAQMAIGKNSINGESTLLDFNTDQFNTRGIILPAVVTTPTFEITENDINGNHPNNGTFIFDRSSKRFKMFENNQWVLIGEREGNISALSPLRSTEEIGQGVIIGSDQTDAKGVFILESPNKAIILPHIADPHINVRNPFPGMICYDTSSNTMAFFDGINWNYYQ